MIPYSPLSFPYSINWQIKRAPVYRILDKVEWIENFFESGELQLSSFLKFRSYKDEMQGDLDEGTGAIMCESKDSSNYIIPYEAGLNGYILSTTKSLNDDVIKDFNGKCAIYIKHPTLFGLEIAKKLPFVYSGVEGSCEYVKSRNKIFNKSQETDELISMIENRNNIHSALSGVTKGMELFNKLDKYKHQKEFRFIWFSDQQVEEALKIRCPEAIAHCDKIIF